jgi:hypothetical protein
MARSDSKLTTTTIMDSLLKLTASYSIANNKAGIAENRKQFQDRLKNSIESAEFTQVIDAIKSKKIYLFILLEILANIYKETSKPENWLILMDIIYKEQPPCLTYKDRYTITTKILEGVDAQRNAQYIIAALNTDLEKDLFQLLTSNIKHSACTIQALNDAPSSERKKLWMAQLISLCISKYNAALLHDMREADPKLFSDIIGKLDSTQQAMSTRLLMLDQEARQTMTNTMAEFSNGFGHITYNGGLFTCAQIKSRKEYQFNPTILKDRAEFDTYLKLLKTDTTPPMRERFVISGTHWISGEINIDRDGKASMLIIDSLGNWEKEDGDDVSKSFPQCKIYYSSVKRQNAAKGCSVFSLDDARHLFTTDRYLESKYDETGLFGYLAESSDQKQNATSASESKSISIIKAKMPLTLLRTEQSAELKERIKARPMLEQEQAVSKKGMTANEQATRDFRPISSSDSKTINMRITDKLNKFTKNNADFLFNNDQKTIEGLKQSFSLEGFKKRIKQPCEELHYGSVTIRQRDKNIEIFPAQKCQDAKLGQALLKLVNLCHEGANDKLKQLITEMKLDVNKKFHFKSYHESTPSETSLLEIAIKKHGEHSPTSQMLLTLGAKLAVMNSVTLKQ